MGRRVLRQVARPAQQAHEDAFGGHMHADHAHGDEPGQRHAVGDDFDGVAGTAERRRGHPLPAIGVDDGRQRQIRASDEGLADPEALEEVLGLPHLADDRKVAACVGRGGVDSNAGCPGLHKCRACGRKRLEAEFERACLFFVSAIFFAK